MPMNNVRNFEDIKSNLTYTLRVAGVARGAKMKGVIRQLTDAGRGYRSDLQLPVGLEAKSGR
jgi:hypothetical protein